jgi:hypothetical protein
MSGFKFLCLKVGREPHYEDLGLLVAYNCCTPLVTLKMDRLRKIRVGMT